MIEKIATRACPICLEKIVTILHKQKFVLPEGHPLNNGYDVVSCKKCGFVFADIQVTQKAYDVFYARFSKYGDKKTSTGGGQDLFDAARLKETAGIIASVLPDKNARVIDIGCANGGLLQEISLLGYPHLLGIDPAKICVETTRNITGVEARTGSLSNMPENIGKFNMVILSHVLEHVQDLSQAIINISNIVAENGCVYVEVPDATRYADQVIAPFQDFNTEHINHFSLNAIHNLFSRVNFVSVSEASRTIAINSGTMYPVIHAVLKRGIPNYFLQFDEKLNSSISPQPGSFDYFISPL